MKKYKNKPQYIQALIDKSGIHIWDLPHTHTFYSAWFKLDDIDEMFKWVFGRNYELVCFDTYKSRYIFKLI